MAGAFDGLLSDSGADARPANLDPQLLAQILALRDNPTGGFSQDPTRVTPGGQYLSRAGLENTPLNGYTLGGFAGSRISGTGDAIENVYDPSGNAEYIFGPTDGGSWSTQTTPVYDTQGRFLGYNSGDGDNLAAAKFILGSMGAYYGTGALNGLGGAAASMTAAEQAAMMAANGMTDAEIVAALGAEGAKSAGLTGVTGSATTAAAGSTLGTTVQNGLQTVGNGLKTLGISGGDLLKTGVAMALADDVKSPQADPNLTKAINGLTGTADAANARAQSNDEYWRTTFAPRYLRAMDDQIAMGRELNNFNMGLARKYDDRYWSTTAKQQDAFYNMVNTYDSEAGRARLAGEAGANVDMQNAAAMQALMRDLNRRGVNPNSGVYLSNQRQQAQQGALQKAMAMNMAREAARKEGLNMRAVAAGLGGNLTGASAGFAGQAAQSAGLGMNGIQGANNGFNSSVGNWNATTGLGINAMNSVGNWGLGLTQGNARANELNTLGFNQMIGYGLGMFGSRS